MRVRGILPLSLVACLLVGSGQLEATQLRDRLGRNESRVYSAPFPLFSGRTVAEMRLPERLRRLGYERVRERPRRPGEYFWGHEVFWVFRHACRQGGRDHKARLLGLRLRSGDSRVLGWLDGKGLPSADGRDHWLEPELLSESLAGDRAERIPLSFDELPEHVWRAVLAAEDARFFDHPGLDARSLARATWANLRSGKVVQGGSTITQQLIKNRDLKPKRSLGRKASEAVRALALEEEFSKEEILESYLDHVYLGHEHGLAIHGLGAAARVYFSRDVRDLDLAQAATLAAMIQGPNRLSPSRHPEAVRERRDWVLGRLEELGWASPREVARVRRSPIALRLSPPRPPQARSLHAWWSEIAREEAPKRFEEERGFVVESTLDPWLQEKAEEAVARGAARLQKQRKLAGAELGFALVSLDVATGDVLAYVGGDPGRRADRFDRVRRASRQPGSTVKPLLLLEALESCGLQDPLYPATRILDEPVTLEVPGGTWTPSNPDERFRGTVTLREALVRSLNVPFVRLARHCGLGAEARRFRKLGLPVPEDPPPSFALGSLEVSPLQLAVAYTPIASDGELHEASPLTRLERPAGRRLLRASPASRHLVGAATSYLVHDLLRDAVARGTAHGVARDGLELAAKTGTSSESRDAWLVGYGDSVLTVVWVGRDDGHPLGLSGAQAAGPIWADFMAAAVPARPRHLRLPPQGVVKKWVDPQTGLLVSRRSRRGEAEIFRRGALPPRDRFWRRDRSVPVVR